jgi:hypothetical protein
VRYLLILAVALMLMGASSERITQEKGCQAIANWAAGVFDIINENPMVILNGMDERDTVAFEFIRQWINDGKSREELKSYTKNTCMGTTV